VYITLEEREREAAAQQVSTQAAQAAGQRGTTIQLKKWNKKVQKKYIMLTF
jgi:hypothetical protein